MRYRLNTLALLLVSLIPTLSAQQSDVSHDSRSRVYPCADTEPRDLPEPLDSTANPRAAYRALSDWTLARRYAPILRFAPGEHFFPTIPFFTAFDDTAYTVATLNDDALPSYNLLREQYLQRLNPHLNQPQQSPPRPVVMYRVCDLAAPGDRLADSAHWKAEPVWRYLRSDEQSWARFGLDTMTSGQESTTVRIALKDVRAFRVIQYFFYYLADWGLRGHPHDIESAFVFLPRDSVIARRFRILVGAGHDPPAPSNVLVYLGVDAEKQKHFNQNILVELGGHSSAPDVPPFGQFSAGLDVNWHIDDVWGTRDEQATGGISFAGRYEGSMTYPRDPEDAITIFPQLAEAVDSSTHSMLRGLVRLAPDALARQVAEKVRSDSAVPRGRLSLADSIISAYSGILRRQQSEVLLELARQAASGQSIPDTLSSALNIRRRQELADTIKYLLRANGAKADSLHGRLKNLLDSQWRFLPPAALRLVVADALPPIQQETADRVADAVGEIVDQRLQPRYSLIPVEYLREMPIAAAAGDAKRLEAFLRLVTRGLFPATCSEKACRAPNAQDSSFETEFRQTVCGDSSSDDGSVADSARHATYWPQSLACVFNSLPSAERENVLRQIALWDGDMSEARAGATARPKRISAHKHKVWQHPNYSNPGAIFRSELFRPTLLQSKGFSSANLRLLTFNASVFPDHAFSPALGIIIPAFRTVDLPIRISGYTEVQLGAYIPWSAGTRRVRPAFGILYDRSFTYFWGWFVKGLYVFGRKRAEEPQAGSDFTVSAGPSLWVPSLLGMRFFRHLHFRPGFRVDTQGFRPNFRRVDWDIQIEVR